MRARTAEQHRTRQAVERRRGVMASLNSAIAESCELQVPPPVTEVKRLHTGAPPKLSAAAFELARQVYYEQHGSIADCARAIIAAGLSDTDNVTTVGERLKTWWARERWPRRSTRATFQIRDASNDGGLYRSQRICIDVATGNGPAPKGKACTQSAMRDSDYCFHHDPRPEFVEKRRVQAERLRKAREAQMVPRQPFADWCNAERLRMLEQARVTGDAHFNAQGWSMLADAMGVELIVLSRICRGIHTGRSKPVERVKVATVVNYLAPLGVSFRDVYGYDPPGHEADPRLTCACGRAKNHQSKTCRECYEAATYGVQCSYVPNTGRRCQTRTMHESGLCAKCREQLSREPKPRYVRPSWWTPARLILALGEYRDVPIHAWVAKRMWSVDAGGVRTHYSTLKTLTGQLVKEFAKRGWETAQDAEREYDRLVAEHGPVPWPTVDPDALDREGMVPFAPFKAWLADRKTEMGGRGAYKRLAARTGLHPEDISCWLRGVGKGRGKTTVRRAIVDRTLERWGDGTTYEDLL